MCRGIRFKIPNDYGRFLFDILLGIDYDKYFWKIDEDNIYTAKGDYLFLSDILSGTDFKRCISLPSYYIVSANLQAFTNYNDIQLVNNYNDFLKSSCQMAMFICDNIFVDIYTKSIEYIEKIKGNAFQFGYKDIGYITDDNDKKGSFVSV